MTVAIRSAGAAARSTIARAASLRYNTGARVSGVTAIATGYPFALASITPDVYCNKLGVVTPGPTIDG